MGLCVQRSGKTCSRVETSAIVAATVKAFTGSLKRSTNTLAAGEATTSVAATGSIVARVADLRSYAKLELIGVDAKDVTNVDTSWRYERATAEKSAP